jgi:hypothetical protein
MLGLGLQLHQYASSGGGGASGAQRASAPANASSIFLDGVDEYLTQPDGGALNVFADLNGSSSWTIAFWIKLTENPTFILWKGNYFTSNYLTISTDATGDIQVLGSNGGTTTINTKWPTDLSLNTWYHIAITSNGSGTNRVNTCYVDGTSAGSPSANTTVTSATDLESSSGTELLKVGALHTLAYYSFYIDDLACWDKALNQANVQQLPTYHAWQTDTATYDSSGDLQLFYRFNDGFGQLQNQTTSANSSGTGNRPITLVNTETDSWVGGGENVPYA